MDRRHAPLPGPAALGGLTIPAGGTGTAALVALGLAPGARVRFRRSGGTRWQVAVVERVERDGSIGLRDAKGASRCIPLDRLEVATTGRRGARTWEPAADLAARDEQLRLL